MSAFLTPLEVRDIRGEQWLLLSPLEYVSELLNGAKLVVPAGTLTDFASIPQCVQSLISKVGAWDRPAVIHDWLYTTQPFEKRIADDVFNEAMKVEGVGTIRRAIIYRAVRMFGGNAWRQHAEDLKRSEISNALQPTHRG